MLNFIKCFFHILGIILLKISTSIYMKNMGLKFSFSNDILLSFGMKVMLIKWHQEVDVIHF